MDIKDKVFVVTGGGSGIGRAAVLELIAQGARVAAVDRSTDGLRGTAALTDSVGRLTLHAIDITEQDQVESLVASVIDAHGTADGLVNVAGIVHRFVSVAELRIDELERVLAVNYWGTVRVTKAFLPILTERPAAALVNVASKGGIVPVPGQGAYGASKAAVKLLTETLFVELAATPIAVSLVIPGAVATGILDNSGVDLSSIPAAAHDSGMARSHPVDATEAGATIVEAIRTGRFRVFIGADAQEADRAAREDPMAVLESEASRLRAAAG